MLKKRPVVKPDDSPEVKGRPIVAGFRRARRVVPAFLYPNMPKSQRCPNCGKRCKRQDKTWGGAKYRCPKDGIFFVVKRRS